MKITKKAKSIAVTDIEYTCTYSRPEYTCPSCHTTFKGGDPNKHTTRFICECGQELIVKRRKTAKENQAK